VLADHADGSPRGCIADSMRGSEYRSAGDDAFGDEYVIAFDCLRVLPGALAHGDRTYPRSGELLSHLDEVDESGRVVAEAPVVSGKPADEQARGPQAELDGDGLVSCV